MEFINFIDKQDFIACKKRQVQKYVFLQLAWVCLMFLTLVCGVTLKMTASLINNAKKIQVEVGGTASVSLELQKRF